MKERNKALPGEVKIRQKSFIQDAFHRPNWTQVNLKLMLLYFWEISVLPLDQNSQRADLLSRFRIDTHLLIAVSCLLVHLAAGRFH